MKKEMIETSERFMSLTADLSRFYASSEGEANMILQRLNEFWYRIVCPGEWSKEKLTYVVDKIIREYNTFPSLDKFELAGDLYDDDQI